MNLQNLFETQKALDEAIVKKKGLEGQDLLPQKILALQVELGECANEWRGFKFWSDNQEPRTEKTDHDFFSDEVTRRYNPLLEEYVDCLHFVLSIGLELGFDESLSGLAIEEVSAGSITEQFSHLFMADWYLWQEGEAGYYHEGLEAFLTLGKKLGFSSNEIEQAYYDKNQINHQRQANGY